VSRFRDEIIKDDYEMFFVINIRRPMTDTAAKIMDMIRDIEESARIRVTGLVNNTNDATSSCLTFGSGETEDYLIGLDFNVGTIAPELNGSVLYPNPTNGLLNVFFPNMKGQCTVRLFDGMGRQLQMLNNDNLVSLQLDLGAYNNGIYFVKVETPNGSITKPIVLQR
ncbi:MAG TPA: T9SS type A sorting domain-containing protein, partial [Bacteroidia bacterium]|nr:T9SS type A sorting domain-containing protein [Bacteroidia bacterium]